MSGLSKVEIGTVATIVIAMLAGAVYIVKLNEDVEKIQKDLEEKKTIEKVRSAAVDEINKRKNSAMSAVREVTSARKTLIGEINSAKRFDQVNCHLIDSGRDGGRLACPVGEYVARATNRTGTNDQLDFLLCCKP